VFIVAAAAPVVKSAGAFPGAATREWRLQRYGRRRHALRRLSEAQDGHPAVGDGQQGALRHAGRVPVPPRGVAREHHHPKIGPLEIAGPAKSDRDMDRWAHVYGRDPRSKDDAQTNLPRWAKSDSADGGGAARAANHSTSVMSLG